MAATSRCGDESGTRLRESGERIVDSSARLRRLVIEAREDAAATVAEEALPESHRAESHRGRPPPAERPACEASVKEMLDRAARRHRYMRRLRSDQRG